MSVVRKLLLRPGVHQAPQGSLDATPERVKRWARQFHAMRKAGIRIPCSWGHQPDAVPDDGHEGRAERQYYLSRFNAGYVEDLSTSEDGSLDCVLDVPGCELDGDKLVAWTELPDGRRVKTAIGEVSAAIRDWRDGTGRVWPDAVIHVALTPLPVVANQTGFRTLSTAPGSGVYYLSLSTLSTEANVADDLLETPASGEGSGDFFQQVLRGLAKRGVHLPDDTTPENAWERLAVALHALEGGEPDGDETMAPPMEGEEGEEGESYSGEDNDETPKEEPRPVMMSLTTATTPLERRLITRQQEAHKARQLKRIAALVKRGLNVHEANKLRAGFDGYTLSMTAEGQVQTQEVDRMLSLLENSLPKKRFTDEYLAEHGRREFRPDGADSAEDKDDIKRRAAAVSRK